MIRILHSVSYMSRGGIETMLMNYYRNIDRSKVQFDFLCNAPFEGAYDEEIRQMGGRIFRSPGYSPLKRFAYKRFMRQLFAEHPEYKIVEAHNDGVGAFTLEAAKKAGVPVRIYHAHSTGFPHDFKFPIKYYCKLMLRSWCNKHFACGDDAAAYFFGDEIRKNGDYSLICNAIDLDKFKFDPELRNSIRRKYDLENRFVIGHVGRFATVKNHLRMVDIIKELKTRNHNVALMLVGTGELMDSVKQKVMEEGLSESVVFVGEVAEPHLFYQAFDLFLMPSLYEGLPLTGVEAQASGLPAIFSKTVPPEIDLTGHCEFIDLSEPDSVWAGRIAEIMSAGEIRYDNYDILTSKNYNIKVEAGKLQNMYLSLQELK